MTARRLVALGATAVLAALGAILVGAPPAIACSCVGFSDAEAFERADVVFTGDAVERREPPRHAIRTSADPTTYVFAVQAVHKGDATEMQEVVTALSGASCGLEAQVGRAYVVFAHREGDGLTAGLCDGTREADPPFALGGSALPSAVAPALDGSADGPPRAAVAAAGALLLLTAAGNGFAALARRRSTT